MAVKLRLQRHGKKRKTFLPIAADATSKKRW
jgi:ribosomal protein S16